MKRIIISLVIAMMLIMALAGSALADHNVGPCNDSGEPGNSDYAQHHIVPAKLGNNAHKPGSHGGYSVCLGTGRLFHQP